MGSPITELISQYKNDNSFRSLDELKKKFKKQEIRLLSQMNEVSYQTYVRLRQLANEISDMQTEDALIFGYRYGKENKFKKEE